MHEKHLTAPATTTTVAHPGELPRSARCADGWQFEIYHPHVDHDEIQMIEAHVACLEPVLDDALEWVQDLTMLLIERRLMAGEVDGDLPGIGWTPFGPVTHADGSGITIGRLQRAVQRPQPARRERDSSDEVVIALPPAPLPGVSCPDGWMFSYRQPVIDGDVQIVECRAVSGEPDLDEATTDFGAWLGHLVQMRLLAMPASQPHISTTIDPLGVATAQDGREVRFE